MISIDKLISHRFRGFSEHENSLAGLQSALEFGVQIVEFDIRVTKCGTPIIYHDEHALDAKGVSHHISEVLHRDFDALGGTFAHMPTADELLKVASQHENASCKLLIDIKDGGFEEEIHALVMLHRLMGRVTYVSWVPNVLFKMHEIAPDIPLCLSYWCQSPNEFIRSIHDVHKAKAGNITRLDRDYIHGERSGWFVDGVISGPLKNMIIASGGSVCVPKHMITAKLVSAYHQDDIKVSTFSYIDWETIRTHKGTFNIDLYFIDNKRVFDEI